MFYKKSFMEFPEVCGMKYVSTRSGETVTAAEALLRGLAADGGLYVPEKMPAPFVSYEILKDFSYQETAVFVLKRFFTEIPEDVLADFVHRAYDTTFAVKEVVPVHRVNEAFSVAELFHGRTCAFKDLALSLFPYLLTWAKKECEESRRILILTATSGDTGKAALEGFRDVDGTNICVFYPSHGVSPLQKDQMQKQAGDNVRVCGIEGNFDDAQSAVKKIFSAGLTEETGGREVVFSSANSINIGRLFPQVVYYVWIWAELVRNGTIAEGERFNIVVPTGNFGNILAAWFAKQIGVPIGQMVCASNDNHILSDFFATGAYDKNREFYLTESPSMDILISSNFERFLYYMTDSPADVASAMAQLSSEGRYIVSEKVMERVASEMMGGWAKGEEVERSIAGVYESHEYLMDPHTSVAYTVYHNLRRAGKMTRGVHTVIASTAHPYKFPNAIAEALGVSVSENAYDTLRNIAEKTGIAIPAQLGALETAPIRFGETIARDAISAYVQNYAKEIAKDVK